MRRTVDHDPSCDLSRGARRRLPALIAIAGLLVGAAPVHAAPAPATSPTTAPAPAPAPTAAPATAPTPPAQPAPPETPAPPPPADVAAPPDAPPAEVPLGPWEPTSDAPPAPAPEPPPEPEVAAPEPPPEAPAPPPEPPEYVHDPVKGEKLRRSGIFTMIGGGVVGVVGLGLTMGYSIRGNGLERDLVGAEDQVQLEDCSRMPMPSAQCEQLWADAQQIRDKIDNADRMTKVGGAVLAAGLLVVAVGGIVYRLGIRKLQPPNTARVRFSPTFGGAVISGRF